MDEMYLGRAGALSAIRCPQAGMTPTPDRAAVTQRLLGGGYVVSYSPRTCRTWSMSWPWMTDEEYAPLLEMYTGQRGAGPWALITPEMRNVLTPNQASGTDAVGDTSGWSTGDATETLSSVTPSVGAPQGTRAVRWSVPSPPPVGQLRIDPPDDLLYFPTPVGQAWTLQAQALSGGADTSVSVRAVIAWVDASGGAVSTSSGSWVPLSSGSWTQVSVSSSAPVGGVQFSARFEVDGSTMSGATQISVDAVVLSPAIEAGMWFPGQGLPMVSITSLSPQIPLVGHQDVSMTLVEVS